MKKKENFTHSCERQKSTQNRTHNVKLLSTRLKYLHDHIHNYNIHTTLPVKQNSIQNLIIIYVQCTYIKSNRVTTSDLGSRINILCQFYVFFVLFLPFFLTFPFHHVLIQLKHTHALYSNGVK